MFIWDINFSICLIINPKTFPNDAYRVLLITTDAGSLCLQPGFWYRADVTHEHVDTYVKWLSLSHIKLLLKFLSCLILFFTNPNTCVLSICQIRKCYIEIFWKWEFLGLILFWKSFRFILSLTRNNAKMGQSLFNAFY